MSTRHPLLRELHTIMDGSVVAPMHGRHLSFFDIKGQRDWMLAVPHDVLTAAPLLQYAVAPSTHEAGLTSATLTWVWPWDIASFLARAGGALLNAIANHPYKVHQLFQDVSVSGCLTQAAATDLNRLDAATLKTFFGNLGRHAELKATYPNVATLCRGLGGEQLASVPRPEAISDTDKALRIIQEVLATVGIILATGAVALGLALAIVGGAVALAGVTAAPSFGFTVPVITAIAVGLLIVVTIGFAITVVIAIIDLFIKGYFIIVGSSTRLAELPLRERVAGLLAAEAAQ